MRKAIVLNADGTKSEMDLDSGNELKNLQDAVGGYVQVVYLKDDLAIWVNEDGKFTDLPLNPNATAIWNHFFGFTDFIVGNAVFTGGANDEGATIAIFESMEEFVNSFA